MKLSASDDARLARSRASHPPGWQGRPTDGNRSFRGSALPSGGRIGGGVGARGESSTPVAPASPPALQAGFSLLEVILAIGIAVGLMMVVLYFYRQAAELRTQAVAESEKIRETRLVMQKLNDELRRLFQHEKAGSFSGNSNSIQFVTTHLPDRSQWSGSEMGRATRPETDLILVRYVGGPTRSNGFYRSAQALVAIRDPNADPALDEFDDLEEEEMTDEDEEEGDGETDAAEDSESDGGEGEDKEGEDGEEMDAGEDEDGDESGDPADTLAQPRILTENIRFSRFRFWGWEEWQDNWSGRSAPPAIEISLGFEPLPEMTEPDEYPYELFRRVIFLDGDAGGGASSDEGELSEEDEEAAE